MSGGVDSSVTAALLKEQGYDVTGVFMKVWYPDFIECNWADERRDAMRVCALLNVPFLTFDFEKEYKKGVVDYMINEYQSGRTPNPDVMCNKEIKFGAFFKKAQEEGADFIATGHYARLRREFPNRKQNTQLCIAEDKNKDQTYFLWTLTQDILSKTLFPIGEYTKPDVRVLAKKYGLPTADKKDSQGLCFIGKLDMKEFLKNYIPSKEGDVLNLDGEVIGNHDGEVFYTLGQRHGFTITKQVPNETPHYIVSKDKDKNTLTVSDTPHKNVGKGLQKEISIEHTNWVKNQLPELNTSLLVRTRYRQKLLPCKITEAENNHAQVLFTKEIPTAPSGQSLVLYNGEECLGGGIIV